jgi:hypothetical protein
MDIKDKDGKVIIRLSRITSDEKLGYWWAIATDKQWIEIRTTKAGKIIPFEVHKGEHPYFTPTERINK